MEWKMISHCIYNKIQEEYVAFYRTNSSLSVDYHNSYIHSAVYDEIKCIQNIIRRTVFV